MSKNDSSELGEDLQSAAHCLEERLRILKVQTRKIADAEWEELPMKIREVVPSWIRTLLSSYSLYGGVLECQERRQHYLRLFAVSGPKEYAKNFVDDSSYWELVEAGFIPLSDEMDGNFWITRSSEVGGAVYYQDLSNWNSILPGHEHELLLASSRLPLLMCSMGINEGSFEEPSTVMWYPEK